MKTLRDMPFTGENNIFKFLEEKLSVANLSEEERWHYETELRVARDNYATMKYAKDEARAEGLAEGRAEGRAQGIAEGIAETSLSMIRRLLGKGKTQDEIIDLLDVDPKLFALL